MHFFFEVLATHLPCYEWLYSYEGLQHFDVSMTSMKYLTNTLVCPTTLHWCCCDILPTPKYTQTCTFTLIVGIMSSRCWKIDANPQSNWLSMWHVVTIMGQKCIESSVRRGCTIVTRHTQLNMPLSLLHIIHAPYVGCQTT